MTLVSKILRGFCSFYPLRSGLGTLANSNLFKSLDGNPNTESYVPSGTFKLMVPDDDYVGRSIKYFGDLDRKVTWVIRQVLRRGDTALDIGANLGLVSFKMLETVGKSGRVFAFEPQSRMVSFIERSIAENGVENLHLQQQGLASAPGVLKLSIPEGNAGAASFATSNAERVEEVAVTTLDAFTAEHEIDTVRLIKIDVEGFEAEVFAGGETFLKSVRPDVIIFEENRVSEEVPASISTIQSFGYEVYALPKSWFSVRLVAYDPQIAAHDFVAIHRDAPTKLRRKLGAPDPVGP